MGNRPEATFSFWDLIASTGHDQERERQRNLLRSIMGMPEGWEPPLSVHIEPIEEIEELMKQAPRGEHAAYLGGKGSG